jgi:hypothetical protein
MPLVGEADRVEDESYRPHEVWHEDDEQCNVAEDAHEAQEGHHVGSQPSRQHVDKGIPPGTEDVLGCRGQVDTRVLVGSQVYQGIVRDALGDSLFWRDTLATKNQETGRGEGRASILLLLGAMSVGSGSLVLLLLYNRASGSGKAIDRVESSRGEERSERRDGTRRDRC